MPYTPSSVVELLLENRHNFTDKHQIATISNILFKLAIKNHDAALALLAKPNRFVQAIPTSIKRETLLEFAQEHHDLVERLIVLARIDSGTASSMRHSAHRAKKKHEAYPLQIPGLANINTPFVANLPAHINGRTYLAVANNGDIVQRGKQHGVIINNEFVPMVKRETRNFNQRLCSVGSHNRREILLLEPQDPILLALYQQLKKQVRGSSDPLIILKEVRKLTQYCFTGHKPEQYIEQQIQGGRKIIPLSQLIQLRQGVCRHHTLLNAYFLSRLVEDNLLKGEVIHHRQDFGNQGAHTWNLFRNQDGKLYSLDSLWNDITCITDSPGQLDQLYRQDVERVIKDMHQPQPQERPKLSVFENAEQKSPINKLKPSELTSSDKIQYIKNRIESQKFVVGDYFFFKGGELISLPDERKKRVPHRVYNIYQAIQSTPDYLNNSERADFLWNKIQAFATDAITNPRTGRDGATTKFYQDILHNLSGIEVKDEISKNIGLN